MRYYTPIKLASDIDYIKQRLCCLQSCCNEVQTYDDQDFFPVTGEVDTLYIDGASQITYIWNGVSYVPVGGGFSLINTTTGNDSTDELNIQAARIGYNQADSNQWFGELATTNNTGQFVLGIGISAANGNIADHVTAIGRAAGVDNEGETLTAYGEYAANSNTGDSLTAIGATAGSGNTGNNVTAIGYNAGVSNTHNNVNLFGVGAAAAAADQTAFANPTNPIIINHPIEFDADPLPYLHIVVGGVDYWIRLLTSI